MKQTTRSKLQQIFALSLLLLGPISCTVKSRTTIPQNQRLLPAKTASRAELLQALQKKSEQVRTFKGTVTLDLTKGGPKTGVLDEYRETRGYVFVDRPGRIRIQVQLPILLTTVAIMVSDGDQYRVSIPIKNQFAIRSVNEPVSPKSAFSGLRPQTFLDGLFVDITPYLDKPNIRYFNEEVVEGVHSYYVFSFFDITNPAAELLEKVWIDRGDLQVSRKQVFGKDGRVDTDVDYQKYYMEEGIAIPKVVVIHRPTEDFTVKMTFQQATLNAALDQTIWDLPRPDGARLLEAGP